MGDSITFKQHDYIIKNISVAFNLGLIKSRGNVATLTKEKASEIIGEIIKFKEQNK